MYIGLTPKILGICIEHFSSVLISDYMRIDKSPIIDSKHSDLEV